MSELRSIRDERPAGSGTRRRRAAVGVLCALGLLFSSRGDALAEGEYFIHMAAPHVSSVSGLKWKRTLDSILALSPAPDLVVVSGDLVDFGADPVGTLNYDALRAPLVKPAPGVFFLDQAQQIPIFFSPGNHDYRIIAQLPGDLTNYKAKIHPTTYYHQIVGEYAIFSLNSGKDVYLTPSHTLPEGSGLFDTVPQDDVTQLESDLDALDGTTDGRDTSSYKKIIFMHHPHQYPKDQSCSIDGVFVDHQSDLVTICEDYDVDWVLFGHLHPSESMVFDLYCGEWTSEDETKVIIGVSAKETGYRKEFSDGSGTGVDLFWPLVSAVPAGGLVATMLLVLSIGAAALRSRRRSNWEKFD
jgi:predicted MPP superfamily phosphohydrolase